MGMKTLNPQRKKNLSIDVVVVGVVVVIVDMKDNRNCMKMKMNDSKKKWGKNENGQINLRIHNRRKKLQHQRPQL